jgi:hypothetical protein
MRRVRVSGDSSSRDGVSLSRPQNESFSVVAMCVGNPDCCDLNANAYFHAMHRKMYADTATAPESSTASLVNAHT